jgi:hypothetical protein
MRDKADKQPPLVERLRKTKSTAKTRFLAEWPQIKDALDAGFTAKAIHAELTKDGLEISYRRFTELVSELTDTDRPVTRQPSQPTKQEKKPEPKASSDSHNTDTYEIKRYHHNPIPNPDELF